MSRIDITSREAAALIEAARRRTTALELFRSQPHQDCIFQSAAREILVRGGNRSGKSTSCAVLTAASATDAYITLSTGERVRARRPHQIGRPLTIWLIGYDQRHIGESLYRMLFRPGLFKIIRDLGTGQWRAFDYNSESDAARADEAQPSFPLIPNRYIKPNSWVYEAAGNNEFKKVTIQHPVTKEVLAEIYAYSSKAEPKAGDPVDLIWIDEAIKYPKHYAEWQARLADRRGRMFWSSWPATSNPALRRLTERAKECREEANPLVQEFKLTTSNNAQLDPEGKRQMIAGWSEEERLARDQGEYALDQLRMYPLFDKAFHCADYPEGVEDEITKALRQNNWQPPSNWTRELILDPGTSKPAVLFVAIPPPTLGEYYVVYDELYPGRADADQLAKMIKVKMQGYPFYRFIIDQRAGKQTPMGFKISIAENYARAFEENNISSVMTGHRFAWGSANVEARIMRLQSWLHINPKSGSFPYLRVVTHKCPVLCRQMEEYVKEENDGSTVGDKPAKDQSIDEAVCLEYFAASFPKWFPVTGNNIGGGSPAFRLFQQLQAKAGPGKKPESTVLGVALTPYKV